MNNICINIFKYILSLLLTFVKHFSFIKNSRTYVREYLPFLFNYFSCNSASNNRTQIFLVFCEHANGIINIIFRNFSKVFFQIFRPFNSFVNRWHLLEIQRLNRNNSICKVVRNLCFHLQDFHHFFLCLILDIQIVASSL